MAMDVFSLLVMISDFNDSGGATNSTATKAITIAAPMIPPTTTPDLSM